MHTTAVIVHHIFINFEDKLWYMNWDFIGVGFAVEALSDKILFGDERHANDVFIDLGFHIPVVHCFPSRIKF